ncbi:uncharacterized protein [Periplaneta americana]
MNRMQKWPLKTEDRTARRRVLSSWRHSTGRLHFQAIAHRYPVDLVEEEQQEDESQVPDCRAGNGDIMQSTRQLTDRDICIVASGLGASWRVLGLRLNFSPETLDAIATSTTRRSKRHDDFEKMAEQILRPWSRLSTATVGRLAVVLWEMGHHMTVLQLQP